MKTTADHASRDIREVLKLALTGDRNPTIKQAIRYFIDVASVVESLDGKIVLRATLMRHDTPMALGLQAWDNNEFTNALVTHDLHSLEVRDLGRLITKARTA